MIVAPIATALTSPVLLLIVATAVLLLLHTPPPVALETEVVPAPMHMPVGPVIVPADGKGITVISAVSLTEPQTLLTVYDIIAVPPLFPLTTPDAFIEATEGLLLLHVPPLTDGENEIVEPWQMEDADPVMVPAIGSGLTVKDVVVVAVPQPLFTV